MIANALKSKTIWFAIILSVLSVLQAYVFLLPITPIEQMYVGIGIATVVTVLRFVTSQPLSDK